MKPRIFGSEVGASIEGDDPTDGNMEFASTHMLRVCTTDELFQICIALVSQVLVNADRRSVIAINSQTLNSNKKTFLDRLWPSLVSADRFEQ